MSVFVVAVLTGAYQMMKFMCNPSMLDNNTDLNMEGGFGE